MSDIVLKVENLYKRYRLGVVDRQAFKEDMISWWAKVRGKPDPYEQYITSNELANIKDSETLKSLKANYVWALQDINFEVKQGEIVGIIGKNGAGKSTLLKILSKTTTPTKGRVKIKGRIASLLEVGTGFHGELTGRENIYLNGAILGMTRHEIKKHLDEIIDFAGVEAYIDTPVKRYSSGMYVRLAFAVGAHLLSDILIVDEVLAVGDADFQKKCIGKMKDVSTGEGKTVLFVSHNMAVIQNLCTQGLLLANGQQQSKKEEIPLIVQLYNLTISSKLIEDMAYRKDREGSGDLIFTALYFLDKNNNRIDNPMCGQFLKIKLFYKLQKHLKNVSIAIGFNSWSGENKIILWTDLVNANYSEIKEEGSFECIVEKFPLAPGNYLINLFAKSEDIIVDWLQEAMTVSVENGDYFGTGKNITTTHNSVLIHHSWK
ncbi:MAG: ABC transporter ATP-binding protein [Thermoflexibacter sp.]|nr:ABC transporter ATP-binding protein [Thermoflexibacter sp.]